MTSLLIIIIIVINNSRTICYQFFGVVFAFDAINDIFNSYLIECCGSQVRNKSLKLHSALNEWILILF